MLPKNLVFGGSLGAPPSKIIPKTKYGWARHVWGNLSDNDYPQSLGALSIFHRFLNSFSFTVATTYVQGTTHSISTLYTYTSSTAQGGGGSFRIGNL